MQKKEAEKMQVLRPLKKKQREKQQALLARQKEADEQVKKEQKWSSRLFKLRRRRCGECGQIFIVHRRCRDQQNKY